MGKTLQDAELDRATDPQYAAISTLAVVGLVLSVAGVIGAWAAPLVAVPALGLIVSVVAWLRIRRSAGVLTGSRLAATGIAAGILMTGLMGGYHLRTYLAETRDMDVLQTRALAIIDDLAAGRYEKVYAEIPADFRARQAKGPEDFRKSVGPLFDGAGNLVSRDLLSLQFYPTDKGGEAAPAEIRVRLDRRILDVTLWFMRPHDGPWELAGIGGEETLESIRQYPTPEGPRSLSAPLKLGEGGGDHQGHQH